MAPAHIVAGTPMVVVMVVLLVVGCVSLYYCREGGNQS